MAAQPDLAGAVATVRARAAARRLGLEVPGADSARRSRDELVRQVDDYLLPRLGRLDAPLLAVVGGSTGAGKSTLVNTLVGAEVSSAGVLRPTTRAPVLLCAPGDERWFADGRVLPGLARSAGPSTSGERSLQLVPHPAVPAGLALLDAPDIDSVVAGNRELAAQLLAAADLWVFVTTAARYADAVPWELLHTAERRGTALAVVCNRVPPPAMREVMDHLGQMLAEGGLTRAALFGVPEVALTGGFIPARAVAPLRDWLLGLAADAAARAEVVRATLDGALRSMSERVPALARAADESSAAAAVLLEDADVLYAAAVRDVDDGVRGGTVLRGLQSRVGRIRDRVASAFTGRPLPDEEVADAVESSVESLVRAAADRAAERTAEAWRGRPGGAALLGASRTVLAHSSEDFAERLRTEVRAWQGDVLTLVSSQGAQRRTAARMASFGVNGAGLAVMLLVFAQTGGLTGAEVLIAGGTSAVSQKVLEAVFGDGVVRAMATQARHDLMERVEKLLGGEAERFRALVLAGAPDPAAAGALRAAAHELELARRASSEVSRPAAAPAPARPAPPAERSPEPKLSWWRRAFG